MHDEIVNILSKASHVHFIKLDTNTLHNLPGYSMSIVSIHNGTPPKYEYLHTNGYYYKFKILKQDCICLKVNDSSKDILNHSELIVALTSINEVKKIK